MEDCFRSQVLLSTVVETRSIVLPLCYILHPGFFGLRASMILLLGMLGVRCMCDGASSFCVDLRSELRSSELCGKGFSKSCPQLP